MEVPFFGGISLEKLLRAPAIWVLIIANISAIIFAVVYNWSTVDLIFLYWCQGIIIGFFYFFRIWFFGVDFEKDGAVRVNGRLLKFEKGFMAAVEFYSIYILINLFYLLFIFVIGCLFIGFSSPDSTNAHPIIFNLTQLGAFLVPVVIFLIAHFFSFLFYLFKKNDLGGEEKSPFMRIIPMHVIICCSFILIHPMGFWVIIFLTCIVLYGLNSKPGGIKNREIYLVIIVFLVIMVLLAFMKALLILIFFSLVKTLVDVFAHYNKHKSKNEVL
ncbi:MAG: DUF6498-containing protein [archaeon]